MDIKLASKCPPLTLREREMLEAIEIRFLIPPIPTLFFATGTQVPNNKLLSAFIDDMLSKIRASSHPTGIPEAGHWALKAGDSGVIDLKGWSPKKKLDVHIIIPKSPIVDNIGHQPIALKPEVPNVGSLQKSFMSIKSSNQEDFLLQGVHILIKVNCQRKIKTTKKRKRDDETKYNLLISPNLTVFDLVKGFQNTETPCRIFREPDSLNDLLVNGTKTASELGWRHGTELRMEMW